MIDIKNINSKEVKDLIFSRQHDQIKTNINTWKFLQESFIGGQKYINSSNLIKYSKEAQIDFENRMKRSVFINHYQPLVELLTGILFNNEPSRIIPDRFNYIHKSISGKMDINTFMQTIALNCIQYPMFILVDSPVFENVNNEAERIEKGINPYCVPYFPWQVRDYSIDANGKFEWIILDNTRIDKTNPFKKEEKIITYRLWTKNEYIDFTKVLINQKEEIIVSEPVNHGRGVVPVVIANSREINFDRLNDSIFEDIAIINNRIYNTISMLDEMLMAGTIKVLFFPIEIDKDLPEAIMKEGLGGLSVVPYKGKFSSPQFQGPNISDASQFISAIEFYIRQILNKIGMNEDREKNFSQSGSAKLMEFRKTELFLNGFAYQLEKTEKEIIKLLGAWENVDIDEDTITIQYTANIAQEDLDGLLSRYYQGLTLNLKSFEKAILKRIPTEIVPDLTEEEQKEIQDEIENMEEITLDNVSTPINDIELKSTI